MTDRAARAVRYEPGASGRIEAGDFRIAAEPLPELADGQVLVATHYLSLDPYLAKGIYDRRAGYGAGDVLPARAAGIVRRSRSPGLPEGAAVLGYWGWRDWAVCDAGALVAPDDPDLSLAWHLGILGQSGFTAWLGWRVAGPLQAGQAVTVSAAAGAVGGIAGQIAKALGCQVVGIAGGDRKCRHVVDTLGFDDCVDHRTDDLPAALAQAAPDGFDAAFDNVGGTVFDAMLSGMKVAGRVAICGQISRYGRTEPVPLRHLGAVLDRVLRIEGFRVFDHEALRPAAYADLTGLLRDGRVHVDQTVVDGLEALPATFANADRDGHTGKLLIRLTTG